jgi:hypothetical protein
MKIRSTGERRSRAHRAGFALALFAALLMTGCPSRLRAQAPRPNPDPAAADEPIGPPSVFDPSLLDRG